MINRLFFLFFTALLCATSSMASKLVSISTTHQDNKTCFIFKFDTPPRFNLFTLKNPNRVVLDLTNTRLAFNLNHLKTNKSIIKSIRSGRPSTQVLRFVFDLNQTVTATINPIARNNEFSLNIVTTKQPKKSAQKTPFTQAIKRPPHQIIIALDPGHGGKDPGAIGSKKTVEKQVTLAIAKKLKQIIDKQPNMKAVLTRHGDYYIGLRQRLRIARQYNASMFISIHADAFINHHSRGASVFALSQSGATSEAARWLAEKENYSELGGVNLSQLDDESGLVRTVLIDLSQTATITAGLRMGSNVLEQLGRVTHLHNRHVEQARFMVLKSPDIPSILIETGFISHLQEEKNLVNPSYQTHLAQAILEGLKRYFLDYPFPETKTQTFMTPTNNVHWVQKGESLSSISAMYNISQAGLKKANHLMGDHINIGQRLVIPTYS